MNSRDDGKKTVYGLSSDDLIAVIDTIDTPIVVVSKDCTVTRYNRAAAAVLSLTAEHIGQSMKQIPMLMDRTDLRESCAQVLAGGAPCRCELKDGDRRFLLRIASYKGSEASIAGAVLTLTNVTAFRASMEQAIYDREFAKTILNTVKEPLVVLDAELRIKTANRAFFTMFRVSREETLGELLGNLKHHQWENAELWTMLKEALTNKHELHSFEMDHNFPLLGRRKVLLDGRRLDRRNTTTDMLLLIFRDITEHKREEAALQQLNEQLEQRVAERTEDLTQSQQRLRALAAELNLTEQRERQRLAGDLHDYLGQLLALTKIKLGLAKQHRMEPPLAKLLGELHEATDKALAYTRTLIAQLSPPVLQEFGLTMALPWLAEQMLQRDLIVTLDLKTQIPPLPEDQALLVFQSVRELLINCAKHAGVQEATVILEKIGESLHITVSDKGAGFDVFKASAVANSAGATRRGFGLFSIRERMLSLGGHIDLRAAPGEGTMATLVLPVTDVSLQAGLRPQEASKDQTNQAPNRKSNGSMIRVLVADDHRMVRQGLCGLIETYDDMVIVGEAANGEEAVSMADQLTPDVILMDVTMPKLDGIGATKLIKHEHPTMAVIGLSVHTAGQVEAAMKEVGAAAFFTKEAAAEQLCEAIRTIYASSKLKPT
jgi:PAS domain S-box-containing protein